MENELLDIVNDQDEVVGQATRKEAHTRGLTHRSVIFFIFDRDMRVFVNQRSASKEFYPERWSIVFGGHVPAGESYEDAVVREAWEETGVIGSEPFYITSFPKRFDAVDRENVRVFSFVVDQMPKLDPSEVQSGQFVTIDELSVLLQQESFLPETTVLFDLLKRSAVASPAG